MKWWEALLILILVAVLAWAGLKGGTQRLTPEGKRAFEALGMPASNPK